MGNLTIATIFIVLINVLMFFSGIAMAEVNPGGSVCYSYQGTLIDNTQIGTGNLTVLNNDIMDQLPNPESSSVSAGGSNIFTDIFNNIIGWFKSTPGIKYVYGVVSAPYNILKCMGLPNLFVAGLGTLWYLVTFLVFIAFLWGRD
jgi:hypothetical protein